MNITDCIRTFDPTKPYEVYGHVEDVKVFHFSGHHSNEWILYVLSIGDGDSYHEDFFAYLDDNPTSNGLYNLLEDFMLVIDEDDPRVPGNHDFTIDPRDHVAVGLLSDPDHIYCECDDSGDGWFFPDGEWSGDLQHRFSEMMSDFI